MSERLPYRLGFISTDACPEINETPGYDWVKSVIVGTFPYQREKARGRYLPARFAYGQDYHLVLAGKLEEIARSLGLSRYEIRVDRNPFDEKKLAWLAGLGFIGRNTLLITPEYGSFVVLGTILTDRIFSASGQPERSGCGECDACLRSCPTGALTGGFDRVKCLSYLTQTASEEFSKYDVLRDAYYGCDICQEACPHNRGKSGCLPEFVFAPDSVMNLDELEKLDKKTFSEKYGNKNFAWIGYLKMLRNIIVLEANNNNVDNEKIAYFQKKYADVPWFNRHMEYLKKRWKHGPQ